VLFTAATIYWSVEGPPNCGRTDNYRWWRTLSELNNLGKSSKMLIMLLALALAGGSFCWGLVYGKINMVPETVVRTVTKDVSRYTEVPVVEVVEKVVEKKVIEQVPVIEYVEVEKEVPVELKQFASEEALVAWLHVDSTDGLTYIKDLFECENYAQTLIRHAQAEGYHMSFQVLKNYTRPDTKEFIKGPHAINSTIIGNDIYFIDPQTDDFWVAYVLEN
jgi:hypothetical protein